MRQLPVSSWVLVVAIILLASLGLAGCGGNSGISIAPSTSEATAANSLVHWTKLTDYVFIANIQMPSGKTLTCIEEYEYTDGGPALSCNWEAYNK